MRAVLPATEPDGPAAGRPLGRALAVALSALALVVFAGVAPAAASDSPAEPRIPQPALILGECDATLSILDLVPGRGYDIAVTDAAGAAVFAASGFVAQSETLDSFVTVPAGVHAWTVVDTQAPDFAASRIVDIAPCAEEAPAAPSTDSPVVPPADALPSADEPVLAGPGVVQASPSISVELLACDLLGASDIRVRFSGVTGTQRAGVAENGRPVAGVADVTVRPSTGEVVFEDLPNGGTYLVWLDDTRGATVATASVTLPICDLPTLDSPVAGDGGAGEAAPGQRTLAATGMPVPAFASVAVLALAAGLLALRLGQRRRA